MLLNFRNHQCAINLFDDAAPNTNYQGAATEVFTFQELAGLLIKVAVRHFGRSGLGSGGFGGLGGFDNSSFGSLRGFFGGWGLGGSGCAGCQ